MTSTTPWSATLDRNEPPDPSAPGARGSALQGALADSRERWRDLVTMSADLAFETDAEGRFTFLAPEQPLGWDADALLGQPAAMLLAQETDGCAGGDGFDPFRPSEAVRGRRVWLRRPDGGVCCLSFAAAPLHDAAGGVAGARGIASDLTDQDGQESGMAASLRRAEVMDHILALARQETLPQRAVQALLGSLAQALGADGAAAIEMPSGESRGGLLHHSGAGHADVLEMVLRLSASLGAAQAASPAGEPPQLRQVRQARGPSGQPVLATMLHPRPAGRLALALWRGPDARLWEEEDARLVLSVSAVLLIMLEHEALQRQAALAARTDALTGLLNRRAFLEELPRHMARLDRDEEPGTLIFADFDVFKLLNERLGHDAGDQALCTLAAILRATFRPTDLVARLGGDEFGVWMNGADQLTAAERAEALRLDVPRALVDLTGPGWPPLTVSIGIAERRTRSMEDIDAIFRRCDQALHDVKRSGRAHWRAAPGFEV
jgi:diguanylate cyclase (GGDEF)-like protein/PAS domain S-box-containing protein